MVANDRWRRRARPLAGWAISAAFVVLLLARVDLAEVADAIIRASLIGLVAAVGLVCLEAALRARRWQVLLAPSRPVAYRRALGYLCVGYFANSLLPARLGDLARAHLAGRDLGIPRLTTLGTIVVERVADAGLIVATVVVLGLLTPAARGLVAPAVVVAVVGGSVAVLVVVVMVAVQRRRHALPEPIARGMDLIRRVGEGGAALRSWPRAAGVALLTVAAFGIAVAEFWVIAGAVGLRLTPVEVAIVMGALALSTSIPAAPGSLGTYELVGVAVLAPFGAESAPALAAVVLMHVVATLPPALLGLAVFMRLHLRVTDLRATPAADQVATA
jgi:uncharacterized membrane protein YbhN (UPF0104 family)